MKGHPGGEEHTLRMLELSGLKPPARILDMGAGAGESVRLLGERGFTCQGIDISPESELVEKGDFLRAPFPAGCFDGILSQCAFYVSGDAAGAFSESRRLLRPGGILMLSDVCFSSLSQQAENSGFTVLHDEDMTRLWREYYIEAIWRGTVDCLPVKGKCGYHSLICRKD